MFALKPQEAWQYSADALMLDVDAAVVWDAAGAGAAVVMLEADAAAADAAAAAAAAAAAE
jgi:hypothetical protein